MYLSQKVSSNINYITQVVNLIIVSIMAFIFVIYNKVFIYLLPSFLSQNTVPSGYCVYFPRFRAFFFLPVTDASWLLIRWSSSCVPAA